MLCKVLIFERMASIASGFDYDIFISYRQKDNKFEGWVANFVSDLKKELAATFKEDLSIYFDENLHDGLSENHDVDLSLREKVKCLVFIPIISRTYCDPKSFAWRNEFLPFLDWAQKDQFGLKVKVANGNVSETAAGQGIQAGCACGDWSGRPGVAIHAGISIATAIDSHKLSR